MSTAITVAAISKRLADSTFRDGKRAVPLASMFARMVKARKLTADEALSGLVEEGLRRAIAVARKDGEKWAGKQTHYKPRAAKLAKAARAKKARKASK